MLQELKAWLSVVVAEEQVEVIERGFDLIQLFDGPMVEETQLNLFHLQSQTDTFDLLSKTTTELAFYSSKLLDSFQITIDDDAYTGDKQHIVNGIMSMILELDANELIDETLAVCTDAETPEEAIANLAELNSGVDPDSVLELLTSVNPKLVTKIIVIMGERIAARESIIPNPYPKEYAQWLVTAMNDINTKRLAQKRSGLTDGVINFISNSTTFGLPIKHYVSVLGDELTNTKYIRNIAEDWILIAIAAGVHPDGILDHVTVFFDLLYIDLVETTAIRKELLPLIKLYGSWL